MTQPDWLHEKSLPTEETFDQFVKQFGGQKISDLLSNSPSFKNADYLFREQNVIAELKNFQTDFGNQENFKEKHFELLKKDDFVSLEPNFIISIIAEILSHSYSSIDAFVYLTLDHYVEIKNNDYANLLWIPLYSGRESNDLPDFINKLGSEWFKFLETKIGAFDNKVITDDVKAALPAKPIPQRPSK